MNASQKINHIQESQYDDDITVTDIPEKHFIAVTGMSLPDGGTTREISVTILPIDAPTEATQTTNSGLYVRGQDEKAVKVTVYQDNNAVADNTTDY